MKSGHQPPVAPARRLAHDSPSAAASDTACSAWLTCLDPGSCTPATSACTNGSSTTPWIVASASPATAGAVGGSASAPETGRGAVAAGETPNNHHSNDQHASWHRDRLGLDDVECKPATWRSRRRAGVLWGVSAAAGPRGATGGSSLLCEDAAKLRGH
jgi:hypothetical protein